MATTTTRPVGSFCWHELATRDTDAATSFYQGLFGWSTDIDQTDMGPYIKFKLGDAEIGATYRMEAPMFDESIPPHWLNYVLVDEVEPVVEKARLLGGQCHMGPIDVGDHGRMAVLEDPTGAAFAVWQPKAHAGTPCLDPVNGAPCWVELNTKNAGTAGEFYTQLFGWKAKTDSGPMPYTEFSVDGQPFAGMMQPPPEQMGDAPSHWLPYYAVDDCDASTAKAAELGGQAFVSNMDIPDVGRFSVIADPTGGCFAIIQLGPGVAG